MDLDENHTLRDISWQCPEVTPRAGQGWRVLVHFLIHQAPWPHALIETITFPQPFVKWYEYAASRQVPDPPHSVWSQSATLTSSL